MSGRAMYLGVCMLWLAGCPQAPSPKAEVLKREGKPDVHSVDGADERMQGAIQTARDTVEDRFIKRLGAPPLGQEAPRMMFKAEFSVGGETEHMWISRPRHENGQLVGTLDNSPTLSLGLKVGDEVRCDPAEISDWMIVEEGKLIGGYTLRAIRDGMTESERQEFDASVSFSFD